MIKIVVDLKGADNPQETLVNGCVKALKEINNLYLYICGDEEVLKPYLTDVECERYEIIDSKDEVTNFDNPVKAFKQKPESSLIKGLMQTLNADGFVSCGSTGAVLVSSIILLKKIGNLRPCLASVLEGDKGKKVCLLDCGANIDCKPEHLLNFAAMGIAYMETIGIENPRVGLLSNGAEEKKGNELVKETHALLKELPINFIGNIEGKEVLNGSCDVLVCDGFAGNVVLKTIEGAAKTLFKDIITIAKNSDEKEKEILMQTVFGLMNKYDYNTKGGAILLGVNKPVIKGHGAGTSETIYAIIKMAYDAASNNLTHNVEEAMNKLN